MAIINRTYTSRKMQFSAWSKLMLRNSLVDNIQACNSLLPIEHKILCRTGVFCFIDSELHPLISQPGKFDLGPCFPSLPPQNGTFYMPPPVRRMINGGCINILREIRYETENILNHCLPKFMFFGKIIKFKSVYWCFGNFLFLE